MSKKKDTQLCKDQGHFFTTICGLTFCQVCGFKQFAPRDPENMDPYGPQNHPLPPYKES
jgi:hypothetical protein